MLDYLDTVLYDGYLNPGPQGVAVIVLGLGPNAFTYLTYTWRFDYAPRLAEVASYLGSI